MQFSTLFSMLAAATPILANTVTFKSQDSTARKIVFTPSAGNAELPDLDVAGNAEAVADFPKGWIGNWIAVCEGKDNTEGMLGEVTFQGWGGITYFDVSAIVDPNDHAGVKQMWPKEAEKPVSGCEVFPCDTAYYLPDDVQTQTTEEVDLVCTLGG